MNNFIERIKEALKSSFSLFAPPAFSSVFVLMLYEYVIWPGALVAQKAVEAGDSEALRSWFIIFKDVEQLLCLILGFWALSLMWGKIRKIRKSNKLFTTDYLRELDSCKDTETIKGKITKLVERLDLEKSKKPPPLYRVLRVSLRRFLVSGDIHSASEVVESEVDALTAKNEAGNSMIRYLIWAVPSIGFIGTVRGIGTALAKADEALAGNISGMTSSLGVAFNSTMVALFISILLMLLLHGLQRLQDDEAVSVNDYLQEKVLDRLTRARATN